MGLFGYHYPPGGTGYRRCEVVVTCELCGEDFDVPGYTELGGYFADDYTRYDCPHCEGYGPEPDPEEVGQERLPLEMIA